MDIRNMRVLILVKTVQMAKLSDKESASTPGAPTTTDPLDPGILTPDIYITFCKAVKSPIKTKGPNKRPVANAIIRPNCKPKGMNAGGLGKESPPIFRTPRPGPWKNLESNVSSFLLLGPPGTGKALIAREIGKMLNTRVPKVVDGLETLNKLVGKLGENIREFYAEAEKESRKRPNRHHSPFNILEYDRPTSGRKPDPKGLVSRKTPSPPSSSTHASPATSSYTKDARMPKCHPTLSGRSLGRNLPLAALAGPDR
ncbi:unnamed protein product [Tuber aestivum]|uniref:Vesicular-fusion protein SEC18 n=1 Tax=Tuber aestivum TaxID=59557 RepID=A0A292Q340_9PEZI|nr:unnamed protein product [Tuber aestivum]